MVEILEQVTYPLLVVDWLDHMTVDHWCKKDAIRKDLPVLSSVGWLVYEDDRMINLVQCVSMEKDDDDVCCQFVIVKSCILSRREIKGD